MSKHVMKSQEPSGVARDELASQPERDPLSPFGHEMLALFRGPLAEVRFPDLDRDILESGAEALLRAQSEVEATERKLDEARTRARDASASFVQSATRALAYARVFATGQSALETLLSSSAVLAGSGTGAVRETREPRAEDREKKKRGRPRKDVSTAGFLDMGAETQTEGLARAEDEAEVTIAAE